MNPQLNQYIQEQLATGASQEAIKNVLVSAGWNQTEVELALMTIGTPLQATPEKPARKSNKVLIASLVLLILLLGSGGAYAYFLSKKKSPSNSAVTINQTTPTATPALSPTTSPPASPSSSPSASPGLLSYNNATYGYSLSYVSTWKLDTIGLTTIVLTSPGTQTTTAYETLGIGDFTIQVSPLAAPPSAAPGVIITGGTSVGTPLEQAKDLIQQIAAGSVVQSVTVGGLSGYSAVLTSDQSSSLNIVLAGKSYLYLLTFTSTTGLAGLSDGQNAIISSLKFI